MIMRLILILVVAFAVVSGCKENSYPRPRGYHRLILPKHTYQTFDNEHCPFIFEYPTYGKLETQRMDSCFFNIYFPEFDAKWHITTRIFDNKKVTYNYSLEDYRELCYKHTQKGTVNEFPIKQPHAIGRFFELYGEVPTNAKFFISDSNRYALMADFYFNTALKNDSLAPIIKHMKEDMRHLIKTIRWK